MSLSQIKVNNQVVTNVDNEPILNSKNLSTSNGIAIKDAILSNIEKSKVQKVVGKNLFDKNNTINGCFGDNGVWKDSPHWCLSNVIEVNSGDSIYINKLGIATINGMWFDKNLQNIEVINSTQQTFTVPDNAKYATFVIPLSQYVLDTCQIEIGDSGTQYEEYKTINIADEINNNLEMSLADRIGTYTLIELKNQQYFESYSNPERISRNDNVITISGSGSMSSSYFGIKHSTMFADINRPAGTKICVGIRAKVTGDLDNIILSASSYPSNYTYQPSIFNLYKDSGYFLAFQYLTIPETIVDGQLYMTIRANSSFNIDTTITIESFGYSVLDTNKNILSSQIEQLISKSIPNEQIQNIPITCKRNGTSGIDADFCGLTAISDAINSITDASYFKRYTLIIDGVFEFTDPLTIPMPDREDNPVEHSIIECKPWISYQGMGVDRTILFVNIPAGATFHNDRSYSDYQPVYLKCEGEVSFSNMSILGKNCRYAFHLEAGSVPNNTVRNIKNCRVIHFGLDGYQSQGFEHAFGCGMGNGQVWNIENCYAEGVSTAFAIHSVSANANQDKFPQGVCNFKNCEFNGVVGGSSGQVEGICQLNFDSCLFNDKTIGIGTSPIGSKTTVSGDYTNVKMWFNTNPLPIYQKFQKGLVLRIDGINEGSIIRFDEMSSAFNSLIGLGTLYNPIFTELTLYETNGYRYKDGGIGLKGFAYGLKDATNNNLAKSLGDCSTISKVLKIQISEVDYTITFSSNYTNMTNEDVLNAINAVISSVATASLYYPAKDYYPHFKNLKYLKNTETESSILRGMAVYFTTQGMRRAKNSDEFIDGVCLDNVAPGQVGRVISSGLIYDMSQRATQSEFTILEDSTIMNQRRSQLGISTTSDGVFDRNASPKVVKCIRNGVINIGESSI